MCNYKNNEILLTSFCVYRHTDEMVKKLETAGLGFFVQADETQQKLGTCVHLILFYFFIYSFIVY